MGLELRRSRKSGENTPSTVDTPGSRRLSDQSTTGSVESQMEDDATTPCIIQSQYDTEMPSVRPGCIHVLLQEIHTLTYLCVQVGHVAADVA